MSGAISVSTGSSYGVKRVCAVWRVARSTFCATPIDSQPARRGPVPQVLRPGAVRHDRRRSGALAVHR